MIILGLNCFHGNSSAASFEMAHSSQPPRRSAFVASSTGPAFPPRRSHICLARGRHSGCPTSITSRSTRTAVPISCGKVAYILAPASRLTPGVEPLRNRRARVNVPSLLAQGRSRRRVLGRFTRSSITRAPVLRVPRVAVRTGGRGFRRWIRRFRQRRLGSGRGHHAVGSMGASISRIRLAFSIRRSPSISAFPHYGDEYKVMGLAPYGRPPSWRPCARSCVCGRTAVRARSALTSAITASRWPINGMTALRSSAICSRRRSRTAGTARKPDDPLDDRHHDIAALGAGDVRGGVLQSAESAACAHAASPISRWPAAAR